MKLTSLSRFSEWLGQSRRAGIRTVRCGASMRAILTRKYERLFSAIGFAAFAAFAFQTAIAHAATSIAAQVVDMPVERWGRVAGLAMASYKADRIDAAALLADEALHIAVQELGSQSDITLTTLEFFSAIRKRQGRFFDATLLDSRALDVRAHIFGFDHPDTLAVANNLAVSYYSQGRYPEAESLFRRILNARERQFGKTHPDTLTTVSNLASVVQSEGRYKEAESLEVQNLASTEQVLGKENPQTLLRVNNLGALYSAEGRYKDAEPFLLRAFEVRQRILGQDHHDTQISASNLAALYESQGRHAQAQQLLSHITVDATSNELSVLSILNNEAANHQRLGNPAEAQRLYRHVLDSRSRLLGINHPDTLASSNNLAMAYKAAGQFHRAEPILSTAFGTSERTLGPEHPLTLQFMSNLAGIYVNKGRFAEAQQRYKRSISLSEHALGRDHPLTLDAKNNLAALYKRQGLLFEAESLAQEVLEANVRVFGHAHPDTIAASNNLALIYQLRGRYAEAEPLYLDALDASDEPALNSNPYVATSLNNLATLYQREGRYADAEKLYLRVLAEVEHAYGIDHPSTIVSVNNLALLYEHEQRYAEAEPLFLRAVAANESVLGRAHPDTITSLANLAALYAGQKRYAEAESLFRRGLDLRQRTLGKYHPDTARILNSFGVTLQEQGRFAEADPKFSHAYRWSVRELGRAHPDTLEYAANLIFNRLAQPNSSRLAHGPAKSMAGALRLRRDTSSTDLFGEDLRDREVLSDGMKFSLVADAAWVNYRSSSVANAAEAFTALQDGMAGRTNQSMLKMAVRHAANAIASKLGALVSERDALLQQWNASSHATGETYSREAFGDDRLRKQLTSERRRLLKRTSEIDIELRRNFPDYFALTRPQAIDLKQTQRLLKPDEAILLVLPTALGTHLMAVSHSGFQWVRTTWTETEVNRAVRRLLWDVGSTVTLTPSEQEEWQEQAGDGYSYDRMTAFNLYSQIVAPVERSLLGKRHIFIAAGGILTTLPFGMLVTERPSGRDDDAEAMRATKWFAEAHALVQIPSIQSLKILRSMRGTRQGNDTGKGFVGFGDPALNGDGKIRNGDRGVSPLQIGSLFSVRTAGILADVLAIRRMPRLPGTARELESIRRALGAPMSSLFLGNRATEAAFRATNFSTVGVIALATHGLLAGEISGTAEPGLIFTPPNRPDETDDGYLSASEISELRLDADWVILSACNTAGGDGSIGAPGLSGIARAFFYAGARHLLVSHWPVRDEVAAMISVRTLEILKNKPMLSRAEALQVAMREVRENRSFDSDHDTWAHPNAWAPFVFVGDVGD